MLPFSAQVKKKAGKGEETVKAEGKDRGPSFSSRKLPMAHGRLREAAQTRRLNEICEQS